MGVKGRKRKLRQMQRDTDAASDDGSAAPDEYEDLPPGVGPPMEAMMGGEGGGPGGGMKASMRQEMMDEELRTRVLDGKGEPKRKKRKPWWERKNWWVGKVPVQQKGAGDEQVEARPYIVPENLATQFEELPLEPRLVKALTKEGFTTMTEIQRRSIPELLANRDVLGQAKTGSGKTLAFVLPVLDDLLRSADAHDGHPTRAVIISPVKELCHQITTVINRLLQHINTPVNTHLITGGTKIKAEALTLKKGVSIVVATPGRLLDHMRHTKGWKWKKLVEWLVIDEADRVLMEGFQKEIDAILQLLADVPGGRTTALFSATMARGMSDLGRLSFTDAPWHVTDVMYTPPPLPPGARPPGAPPLPPGAPPQAGDDDDDDEAAMHDEELEELHSDAEEEEEVMVGEEEEEEEGIEAEEDEEVDDEGRITTRSGAASSLIDNLNNPTENYKTPVPSSARLRQTAMVVPAADKLVRLYKLLRELDSKGAKKMIVFFATCASAQFHCMMLNTILNGDLQCLQLHGKMKHRQRVATFDYYCNAPDGVLFCTDVVARGLDIPAVEWIIQYDPPTDPSEYLHRVGRTARGGGSGDSMLFLLPQEVGFLDFLRNHGITIDQKKLARVDCEKYRAKMHQIILQDNILEKNARAGYKATLMSYQQHNLKQYFNVKQLPLAEIGHAFCLADSAPQVHLSKGDGERAPYVDGILKSMKRRHARNARWEKGGKAKQQWEGGKFVGRRQKNYIT